MKILLRQTGGFAGVAIDLATIDTASMPPDAARAWQEAIEDIKFFSLRAAVASEAIGADMLVYQITVEDSGRRHTVSFVDDDSLATARLRRLKDRILEPPG